MPPEPLNLDLDRLPLPAVLLTLREGGLMVVAASQSAQGLLPKPFVGTELPLGAWMDATEASALARRWVQGPENQVANVRLRGSVREFAGRLRARRQADQGPWLVLVEDVSQERGAMDALRENESSYRRIVELSPDAIVVLGEGLVVFANQACERLLGMDSPAELWGTDFSQAIHPGDKPLWEERARELELQDEGMPPVEMRLLRKDGTVLEAEVTQYRAFAVGLGGMQVILRDIGPRKAMERELKESEERYKGLAAAAFDGVAVHVDGRIKEVNQAFEAIFGCAPGALVGESIEALFESEHSKYFRREKVSGKVVELEAVSLDGKKLTLEASTRNCRYQGVEAFVTALRDVTQRKQAEEQVRQQAYFDGLTGLPNRILFDELLKERLDSVGTPRVGALLFLDLDRFKQVNDSLGHDAGDRLLQQAANRLGEMVRPGDTVCRIGGDEFTVLLDDVEGEAEVALIAGKIVDQLCRPFDLGNETVNVGSSIGIAMIPAHGKVPALLIKHADQAMYAVKASGRNAYRFWNVDLGGEPRDRRDLEAELKQAIVRQEFRLHYLPKVDLASGSIVGVEALIRWQRGDQLLKAAEFVPFAEEVGLTLPMGEWVLDRACRQARQWQDLGLKNLTVSINLSAWQLRHQALLDLVDAAMELYSMAPSLLELEVTEKAAMMNPGFTASILKELTGRGLGVSLDDFGTGSSSLEHLKAFPIRTLKIDRSFVKGCDRGAKDSAVVRAIITLAHSLGQNVLAEGVETASQAQFLRAEGCDLAQGHLFSQAVAPEQIPAIVGAKPFLFER